MKYNRFIALCAVIAILLVSVFGTAYAVFSPRFTPGKSTAISCDSIAEYVAFVEERNIKNSDKTVADVVATITFSRYVDFSTFENYVNQYSIDTVQLQLRGINSDGERVTVFSKIDKGIAETETIIDQMAIENNFSVLGITAINAFVASDKLVELQNDPLTYLADTTGDGYFRETIAENSVARSDTQNSGIHYEFPHSITWDLEDLGILHYE